MAWSSTTNAGDIAPSAAAIASGGEISPVGVTNAAFGVFKNFGLVDLSASTNTNSGTIENELGGIWNYDNKLENRASGKIVNLGTYNVTHALTSPGITNLQSGDKRDTVLARAERNGSGDGRVYRISFTTSDGRESCAGSTQVSVPQSRKGTEMDSGQLYDSMHP